MSEVDNNFLKHGVLLHFESVYLVRYNEECVAEIAQNVMQFGFCHTAYRLSQ